MSDKNNKIGSGPINQEEEDKKLWKNLKIKFSLESSAFSGNKIYGTINIIPEEAHKLIKNFVLVVNDSNEVEFSSNFRKISASGFDPTKTNFSVYIKAIPKNRDLEYRKSKTREFCIIRQRVSLSPTLSCNWTNGKDSKLCLIVRWFNIGYRFSQQYVLCLDDKEIYYIREPLISSNDAYQVCISYLKPDIEHTIQIKARLNNGKETYQSDRIKFIVPNDKNKNNIEIINVFEEPGKPDDLQDSTDEDAEQKKKTKLPQMISETHNKKPEKVLSCGCQRPHDKFPGVGHYYELCRSNRASCRQSTTCIKNRRTISSNEEEPDYRDNGYKSEEKEDDDDNDVILVNIHADI